MKKLLILPFIVTLLRQCSQEVTRYVMSLVSPQGNSVIPNSSYCLGSLRTGDRHRVVCTVPQLRAVKLRNLISVSGTGKNFFLSNFFQTDLWPTYHFIEEGPRALSPRDKGQGGGRVREDNHSLPFSTESKNEWISTSTEFCTACHV